MTEKFWKSSQFHIFAYLLKAVCLLVIIYEDTWDDVAVWFVLIQTLLSVVLVTYRDIKLTDESRERRHNAVTSADFFLQIVAVFVLGLLWEYYRNHGKQFAFFFLIIAGIEAIVAIDPMLLINDAESEIKFVKS